MPRIEPEHRGRANSAPNYAVTLSPSPRPPTLAKGTPGFKAELIACIRTKRPGPGPKAVHGQLAGGHEDVGMGLIEPASETGTVQNDNGCQRKLEASTGAMDGSPNEYRRDMA